MNNCSRTDRAEDPVAKSVRQSWTNASRNGVPLKGKGGDKGKGKGKGKAPG
jgi:hypothetical protein